MSFIKLFCMKPFSFRLELSPFQTLLRRLTASFINLIYLIKQSKYFLILALFWYLAFALFSWFWRGIFIGKCVKNVIFIVWADVRNKICGLPIFLAFIKFVGFFQLFFIMILFAVSRNRSNHFLRTIAINLEHPVNLSRKLMKRYSFICLCDHALSQNSNFLNQMRTMFS